MTTILIAEDNTMIGMMMQMDLEDAGYEVLGPAVNNMEALMLAERTRADLALVDIDLKGGDSGLRLAAILKADHGVPSLFVTGQVGEATAYPGIAIGVLTKPFQSAFLIETVAAGLAYLKDDVKPTSRGQAIWF